MSDKTKTPESTQPRKKPSKAKAVVAAGTIVALAAAGAYFTPRRGSSDSNKQRAYESAMMHAEPYPVVNPGVSSEVSRQLNDMDTRITITNPDGSSKEVVGKGLLDRAFRNGENKVVYLYRVPTDGEDMYYPVLDPYKGDAKVQIHYGNFTGEFGHDHDGIFKDGNRDLLSQLIQAHDPVVDHYPVLHIQDDSLNNRG